MLGSSILIKPLIKSDVFKEVNTDSIINTISNRSYNGIIKRKLFSEHFFHVKDNMKKVLDQIQDGTFASEWINENEEGRNKFLEFRKNENVHRIEEVGKDLRKMMPWLDSQK